MNAPEELQDLRDRLARAREQATAASLKRSIAVEAVRVKCRRLAESLATPTIPATPLTVQEG